MVLIRLDAGEAPLALLSVSMYANIVGIQSAPGWSRVSRGGAESPLVMGRWEQERFLAAPEAAGFHRGRHAPWLMGFGESEVSPMVLIRLDAGEAPAAGGMQRGRAAGPLAKIGVVLPRTSCA
jgi:hypothetical protein